MLGTALYPCLLLLVSAALASAQPTAGNPLDTDSAAPAPQASSATGPWGGTFQNPQLTLELKAKAAGAYEGTLLFKDQKLPVSASGDARLLKGTFRNDSGAFDFTMSKGGDAFIFKTGARTYQLKKAAVNPLDAEPEQPPGGSTSKASKATSQLPAGYEVVTATELGKKLVAHKAGATSVPKALSAALRDLAPLFDSPPTRKGAFADTKAQHWGAASFTAQLQGQPVNGVVSCATGDQGADLVVTYCRADAPNSEWSKLGGVLAASPGLPAGLKLTTYQFPDGTGSIQLPDGWQTTAQSCIKGFQVRGPANQLITISMSRTVDIPNSLAVQTEVRLARMGIHSSAELLVAPFTGPVEALKNLMPQLSRQSVSHGGPAVELDRLIGEPQPERAGLPNGQAATLSYAYRRIAGGQSVPYRAIACIQTSPLTSEAWMFFINELTAPEASFAKDLPLMQAIFNSYKSNSKVIQQQTAEIIRGMNQRFHAQQQAHAENQQAFDGYLQTLQNNSDRTDRSTVNFIEVLRGEGTIQDTVTGERRNVNLAHLEDIVDALNRADPNRYAPIPLRDQ
jgi:hypothetical protein